MNKEEILAASRKENNNRDLSEIEVINQASRIAYVAGCIICMTMCVIQFIYTKTVNWGCWVVDFGLMGTVFLVKAIKLRKKHEIFLTAIYFVICLFFFTGFIMSVKG